MENLLMNIPLIKEKGVAGSAVRGDLKIAMIATRDIASYVAERLVKRDFEGKTIQDLLGQRDLSLHEATSVIGRAISMPDLKYAQFSYDDTAKWMAETGISEDVCRLIVEMSNALNDRLICVDRPRTKENTTPTSIEEFAGTFAKAYAASRYVRLYKQNPSNQLHKPKSPLAGFFVIGFQAFFTNSDFNFIAPIPSILQSILWSPSTRRMFFTLVPTFSADEAPFTFRSLITVTASPSCSTFP
jgi:hypothetical protein